MQKKSIPDGDWRSEMAGNLETARAFFEACETGQGWDACQPYCHADAGFAAQSGAIADIVTVTAYT